MQRNKVGAGRGQAKSRKDEHFFMSAPLFIALQYDRRLRIEQ
jgi:hypothetical protein